MVKRGHGPSSLGRDREPLYEFATLAVSELKRTCLTAITDQFLCVKVFRYNGNLILNSIGGFNAECDPIEAASEIDFLIRAWWLNKLRDMIVHVLKQRRTNGVIF